MSGLMEKVGLYVVDTILALTKKGYRVQFIPDIDGMLTIVYTHRYKEIYHHDHCGTPGCSSRELEKHVIASLRDFWIAVEAD
jgi:hypothetical protein